LSGGPASVGGLETRRLRNSAARELRESRNGGTAPAKVANVKRAAA
jgi:hypothetical protein